MIGIILLTWLKGLIEFKATVGPRRCAFYFLTHDVTAGNGLDMISVTVDL